MKFPAIAAGLLFATAAASASAQVYYERSYTYDPYYGGPRTYYPNAGEECWNPRAGHFEAVRPGESQGDLDFAHCRPSNYSGGYSGGRYLREGRQECWNPRSGHYESVRPGEYQNDLDFSRCRVYRY